MRSKQVSVKREIRPLRSTWRGLETWHGRDAVTPRNRKGEATGNTNCDLNRRASLRPYCAEVTKHNRPGRKNPAALRSSCSGRDDLGVSKLGGRNIMEYLHPRKHGPARSRDSRERRGKPTRSSLGEGR